MARLIIKAWNHELEIPAWRTYEEPKLLATLEVVGSKLPRTTVKAWGYEDGDIIYRLHKNVAGVLYVLISADRHVRLSGGYILAPWSNCDYLTVKIL